MFRRILICMFVVALPGVSLAQELTPRAFWPAPEGTRIISAGYSFLTGDSLPDPTACRGGRSTVDGEKLDDLQRDTKMGFTLLYPFMQKTAVKFSYSKGSLNDSSEDFDTFLVALQRRL